MTQGVVRNGRLEEVENEAIEHREKWRKLLEALGTMLESLNIFLDLL